MEKKNEENINDDKIKTETKKSSSFLADLKNFSFDTIKIVVISTSNLIFLNETNIKY